MLARDVEVEADYPVLLYPGTLQEAMSALAGRMLESNISSQNAEDKFSALLLWVSQVAGAQQDQLTSLQSQLEAIRQFIGMPDPGLPAQPTLADVQSPDLLIGVLQAKRLQTLALAQAGPAE